MRAETIIKVASQVRADVIQNLIMRDVTLMLLMPKPSLPCCLAMLREAVAAFLASADPDCRSAISRVPPFFFLQRQQLVMPSQVRNPRCNRLVEVCDSCQQSCIRCGRVCQSICPTVVSECTAKFSATFWHCLELTLLLLTLLLQILKVSPDRACESLDSIRHVVSPSMALEHINDRCTAAGMPMVTKGASMHLLPPCRCTILFTHRPVHQAVWDGSEWS